MNESLREILIVDDDPSILRLLRTVLEADGFRVRAAADGEEAWRLIEEQCPSYVLTDWEMPRGDGIQLLERIRREALPQYVYSILLTVRSGASDLARAIEAGADDFMPKPLAISELRARLKAGERVLELEQRLRTAAKCDPLTGLLNRRSFYEGFEREWARSRRYGSSLACVVIDIDFFKKINDTYGHGAGDAVLRVMGSLLKEQVRTCDYACRYGGEEFCVLLPETDEAQATAWADRFLKKLRATEIDIGGDAPHRITASFGAAEILDDTVNPEALVDMADQALLVAKQSGRDRVVRFLSLRDPTVQALVCESAENDVFKGVLAHDVMTALVYCLKQEDSVDDAAEFFLRMRTNSAPVVDADGKLVGIVSEKDLVSVMFTETGLQKTVSQVMKQNVVCYPESTPARQIYDFLCRVSIRRVVVVRDGRPVGIVSRGSLLRWFRNWAAANHDETGGMPANDDEVRILASLNETAREVAERSTSLAASLAHAAHDFVPLVVAEATRLQELTNDLLAHCQTPVSRGAFSVLAHQSLDQKE